MSDVLQTVIVSGAALAALAAIVRPYVVRGTASSPGCSTCAHSKRPRAAPAQAVHPLRVVRSARGSRRP